MSAPAAVRVPGHQGSIAWLDNRRDVVGSSDIPVITGSSPYRTSIVDLWAVKTRLLDPEPPDAEDQELFDLGHAMEDVVAERASLLTGHRYQRVRDMLRHPTIGWAGASLDRRQVGARRLLECKWAPNRRWADGPEPIPGYVMDQVQWALMVTGWEAGDVAVLNGSRVEIHAIEADRGYQDDLVVIAHQKLWRYVESGEMPPVDGSETTRRTLARLADRRALVNGKRIRADGDLDRMARQLREAQQAEKAATKAAGSIKNAIGALLLAAEASGIDGSDYGWRLDWHRNADSVRDVTDHAAVASLYRGLLAQALAAGDQTVRGALRDSGFDPDAPDLLDVIEGLHTTTETKAGARPMRLWMKGDDGKWL